LIAGRGICLGPIEDLLMRIRYVALALAAGVSALALAPARAADAPEGYGAYEQDSDRYDEPAPRERRVHVEERYVDEEPIVEERVVRRRYVEAPEVYVGPRFVGPSVYVGPRWGWRGGGWRGHPRWAHRGRW
jgi:hypothetical protein